jgi:hypothetical protein
MQQTSSARRRGILRSLRTRAIITSLAALLVHARAEAPERTEDSASPAAVIPSVVAAAPAFAIDPISDEAIIVGAAGFAGMPDLIDATGEVRPRQISPEFDRTQLLRIDRGAISQSVDPSARSYSNVGLAAVVGYALLDPIRGSGAALIRCSARWFGSFAVIERGGVGFGGALPSGHQLVMHEVALGMTRGG